MTFNIIFGSLFIAMIVLGLWLNNRAEQRRSIFEDRGGVEINNTLVDMFGEGGSEEIKSYYKGN